MGSGSSFTLPALLWMNLQKASIVGNESKEKSAPAQGQPITPPKPEEQEPNAMECAGLFPATSHQLDSWLERLGEQVTPHCQELEQSPQYSRVYHFNENNPHGNC